MAEEIGQSGSQERMWPVSKRLAITSVGEELLG